LSCLGHLGPYLREYNTQMEETSLFSKDLFRNWGKLICLAKPILRTESFESMKVLIVTDILRTIHCDLILNIEDLGYRILIREISQAVQAIQTVQTSPSSQSMEAMDSNNGVLGFEDIEDDVAFADMAQDDSRRLDTVATEDEVVKETEDVSNEDKQANGSPGDSLNSTTRTRTANFSQNGYSEEIFKIFQHAPFLGLGAEYQQPEHHAYQPSGFQTSANDHANTVIDGIAFPPNGFGRWGFDSSAIGR